MQRCAAILAISGLLFCATSLQAQETAGANPVGDPPDTEYGTGDQPLSPAIERKLPPTLRYRAFLPVAVDLSSRMPRPGNQGKANSCQAWATAFAARSYYTSTFERRDLNDPINLPSPNYIYNLARERGCEAGSNIYRTVEVLRNGALSLAEYPYTADCAPPPLQLQTQAHDFQVRGFRRVDIARIDDVKGQLARANPVIISFRDSIAFHRHRGDGIFSDATFDPGKEGWHAMALVGYDDRRQAFRLINSWGPGWGDRGYAWLSYEVFRARVRGAYVLDVAEPRRPSPLLVSEPDPAVKSEPAPTAPAAGPQRRGEGPQPPALPNAAVAGPTPPSGAGATGSTASPVPPPPTLGLALRASLSPDAPAPIIEPPAPASDLSHLQKLACAGVTVAVDGERRTLNGFVASDADLDAVKAIAARVPGASVGDVVVAPWPQCEALQTLEKPLASTDQPKIAIRPKSDLREGDPITIEVQSPSAMSYIYVSYVQADGSVKHLARPKGTVPEPTLPNRTLVFGDGKDRRQKFVIGAPFGREMVIVIAAHSPLFAEDFPAKQTERDYLSALRRALIYRASPDMPEREVTAAVKTLQTRAK